MKLKLKQATILALLTLIITSCNSYEKLTYLQDIEETKDTAIFEKKKTSYKLQAGDLLYIQIITENREINELFNPLIGVNASQYLRPETMFYTSYLVNDSGYIEMPLLDKIYVSGLSMDQAQDTIKLRAKKYLKNPQIIAKLANFKFTVLGEVKIPGVKQVTANQVNIMEALAYGGDISYNGNRKKILLLRQTEKGTQSYRINIAKSDIIKSELYYIMPNDIIYVEPLKSTLFREQTSDYVFVISAVSTTLTAVALILNLLR
ncbi:MAG: polysaccharide biosynthesis/export family protein [Bacteroidales bacterium]|jgi:polysaccharide export outer membrane protein|nr:polysaccharide biosynthesis/export family protein [Bacteroidales bacterium]